MVSLLTACKRLLFWGLLPALPLVTWAQNFAPQGSEYSLGALPGDQMFPQISVTPAGGYIIWQDNTIDGHGLGIAAQKLTKPQANESP